MSLWRRRAANLSDLADFRSRAPMRTGTAHVTNESALRMSAVWACLRLRADLISTFPVDTFRKVNGRAIEVPKPPVLVKPGGERVGIKEWMYSTQFDLDRAGNCFGIITERDARDRPARIDLAALSDVSVRVQAGELVEYRIGQESFKGEQLRNVWHEKQFTVAGLHVGLSPTAYAAWSIGEFQSIQQFALDWFGDGTIPAAMLKNTAKKLNPIEAQGVKDRFKATVANRDVFVAGADWEYQMIQAENSTKDFVEAKQFDVAEIARFYGAPVDLIDGAVATGSITYASMTQRNLQFLIMNLGPAVDRREDALSPLVGEPRYVKLNTDALLRMDPEARARMITAKIADRTLTNTEARALDDRAPLTSSEIAEFDRIYGQANPEPAPTVPQEVPA